MKLYWRPGKISNASLVVLAVLAMAAMIVVEHNMVIIRQPHYDEKVRAVRLQSRAMEAIKQETLRQRKKLDAFADPAGTGMIGLSLSPMTSVVGYVEAKQTSANPNFAAVVVELMKRLDLAEGDFVAVGGSGSFPALNLATLVACKVLKLNCVPIMSMAASMYGANDPRMTWLDMERIAYEAGAIDHRSIAASIGGMDDNGEQLQAAGVELILQAITRSQVPLIRTESLQGNIDERIRRFQEAAGGRPFKAYVNIGGSEASVGSHFTKVLFKPGINRRLPRRPIEDEGAMTRMMREYDIPMIHLSSVSRIAERHGLPVAPQKMPPPAEGPLFFNREYNLPLVAVLLGALIAATVLVIRFDIGRLLGRKAG